MSFSNAIPASVESLGLTHNIRPIMDPERKLKVDCSKSHLKLWIRNVQSKGVAKQVEAIKREGV